jgi:hypothetical protein
MVHYIVLLWAKPGQEAQVTRFYQDLEPTLRAAKGYRGRQLLRARHGTLSTEVRRAATPEELARQAGHAHPHAEAKGVQFVIVEQWDSVEDRMAYSRGGSGNRARDLFPHILPEHSHEFYEDVTPA